MTIPFAECLKYFRWGCGDSWALSEMTLGRKRGRIGRDFVSASPPDSFHDANSFGNQIKLTWICIASEPKAKNIIGYICRQLWLLQCDMKHQVKIDQQRPVCRPHLAQVPFFSCLVGQCLAYSIKKEECDGSLPVRRVSGYFWSIIYDVYCSAVIAWKLPLFR